MSKKLPRWTQQQVAAYMAGRSGLFLMEYRHDSWCQAQRTQRMQDCTCNVEVYLTDHRGRGIARIISGPAGKRDN